MNPDNQQPTYTPQAPQTPSFPPQSPTPQMPVQPQNPTPQQMPAQPATPKKIPILLIAIIGAVIVIGAIAAIIIIPKLSPDNGSSKQETSNHDTANTVKGIAYSELASIAENPGQNGLYKIGDEYVYKGHDIFEVGDKYEKIMKEYVNNFVKFNDHYWRILRIKSDGSMKLLFVGGLDDEGKYYNDLGLKSFLSKDKKTGVTSYEESEYREQLNTTFLNNTKFIPSNYKDFLAKGKVDISMYEYNDRLDAPKYGEAISNFEDYVMPLSALEVLDTSLDREDQVKGRRIKNWITTSLSTNGSKKLNTYSTATLTSNLVYNEDGRHNVIEIGVSHGEYEKDIEYGDYTTNILPVITVKSNIGFKSGSGSFDDPYILDIK